MTTRLISIDERLVSVSPEEDTNDLCHRGLRVKVNTPHLFHFYFSLPVTFIQNLLSNKSHNFPDAFSRIYPSINHYLFVPLVQLQEGSFN